MHLLSTVNRLSKSDGSVPVSMFVYGAERKFLRVFEDYVETTQNVIRAFGIELDEDSSISFTTSTLDICDGREVVIDSTAYPVMWTVLDEIRVFVVVADDSRGEMRGPGKAAPAKQNSKSSAISNPRPHQVVIAPQPSILPPLDDAEPQRSTVDSPPLDKGKSKASNGIVSKAADSIITQLKTWPMESLITPSDDRENNFLGLDSPSERGHDKESPKNFSNTPTLNALREKTSLLNGSVASFSKIVEQPQDGTLPEVVKKEKAEEPRKAVNGSSTHEERTPLKSALKRSPSQRSVRKEKETASRDEEEDPRFEIYIMGPKDQGAQFKTRGRHPVRKVLQAACKAFGLDYDRAHLMLSVTIEDEDGEEQTHEFACGVDDTMMRCGVNSESKLFVRIDPDSDDAE